MVIVVDGASGIRSSHVVAICISCSLCKGMLSFNMELFSLYSALLGKAPYWLFKGIKIILLNVRCPCRSMACISVGCHLAGVFEAGASPCW